MKWSGAADRGFVAEDRVTLRPEGSDQRRWQPLNGIFCSGGDPGTLRAGRSRREAAVQLTLRETPFPHTDAITWFARGLGAAQLGQPPAANESATALRQMKATADLEDGTEKSAVTPGPLAPARELLGDMLLEMNEPAQARDQFEATLKKEPGRFRSLY